MTESKPLTPYDLTSYDTAKDFAYLTMVLARKSGTEWHKADCNGDGIHKAHAFWFKDRKIPYGYENIHAITFKGTEADVDKVQQLLDRIYENMNMAVKPKHIKSQCYSAPNTPSPDEYMVRLDVTPFMQDAQKLHDAISVMTRRKALAGIAGAFLLGPPGFLTLVYGQSQVRKGNFREGGIAMGAGGLLSVAAEESGRYGIRQERHGISPYFRERVQFEELAKLTQRQLRNSGYFPEARDDEIIFGDIRRRKLAEAQPSSPSR